MECTDPLPAGRTATLGAMDLQLTALKRLAAARDVLSAILEGRLDSSPRTVDALATLVGRASGELRLAREEVPE